MSVEEVVLISGAGAGIGRACARRFMGEGYRLLVADYAKQDLACLGDELKENGADYLAIQGDIAIPATAEEMAAKARERWGRIDALVANAGIQDGGALLDSKEADWDRVLGVNLKGVAWSCKAVLPAMLEQKNGAIVIISSVNAVTGCAGMAAYDASKSAVLGLMRSLAIDYGSEGVRVNSICPGNTLTDFHIRRMAERGVDVAQLREMTRGYGLLGRAAEPEEIANAVFFLASEQASFITGQSLAVDGGFSLARS